MKHFLIILFSFILSMPAFCSAKENIEKVNKQGNTTVLEGSAFCLVESAQENKQLSIRQSPTNLEYDAKYLKDGKAKNFERSNIEYSGVTDFFKY